MSTVLDRLSQWSLWRSPGVWWCVCRACFLRRKSSVARVHLFPNGTGSITINGVSLTINKVEDTALDTLVTINLIPHTLEVTTLKHLKAQSYVNVEIDTIARYVERIMSLKDDDALF